MRGSFALPSIFYSVLHSPNTTHTTQPLDVRFFKPLKSKRSSVCHEFMTNNPGSVITKMSISQLFSKSWYQIIKPENIINGFRATKVCLLKFELLRFVTISHVNFAYHGDRLPRICHQASC